MSLSESKEVLERLPDPNKQKLLNKVLGTDFLLRRLRTMSGPELGNFRVGAAFLAFTFGGMAYYFYWQYRKTVYMSSMGYYKLINAKSLNAGNQFIFESDNEIIHNPTFYYRMPKKEFDVLYRMKSAFITGQFDHNKEVLIPSKKFGIEGFDVYTPFYYYRKVKDSPYLQLHSDGKLANGGEALDAAIPVYRGWIPKELKDRRLRPKDYNCGKETLRGTIKLSSVDKHDFTIPNDPSRDLWTNASLRDMAEYWELPNATDAQSCYFQEINFETLDTSQKDIFPVKTSIQDAIAQDGLEQGINYTRNYKGLWTLSSSFSGFFLYMLYLVA